MATVARSPGGVVGWKWKQRQGDLVRLLRHSQGKTQVDLAVEVGLTHNSICSIETGRMHIPPDRVAQFAAAFGVDLRAFAAVVLYCHNPTAAAHIWPALTLVFDRHDREVEDAAKVLAKLLRMRRQAA